MGTLLPLKPMKMVTPKLPVRASEFSQPTIDLMREQVYGDGKISHLNPIPYKGGITPAIENMLESMYKLTKLSKALSEYGDKGLSHVTPYNDDNQHLRCYISESYIVVYVTTDPKNYDGWKEIIANHGADDKTKKRYYEFEIIEGLAEEKFLEKITEGIECVITTVEMHLFDVMNKTKSTFEQIKHIRIGTAPEIKSIEKEMEKEYKSLVKEEKKKNKKSFWRGLFRDSKVSFS